MRPVERLFENDLIGREERAAVLVIEGARILDPAEGLDMTGDIVIEGEKIRGTYPAGLGREEARRAGEENVQVIDARGLAAAPGLVDVHVHFRDPGQTYKEDIETGARAAARGGYTTVVPSWTAGRPWNMFWKREEKQESGCCPARLSPRALRAGS